MKRYVGFDDAALLDRLERLDRAEADLQGRIAARTPQVDAEGRWLRGDPLFRQLSSTLKRVRAEMRDTEEEVLRRSPVAAETELAVAEPV